VRCDRSLVDESSSSDGRRLWKPWRNEVKFQIEVVRDMFPKRG